MHRVLLHTTARRSILTGKRSNVREFVHRVANLLAVIQTQAEVADLQGTGDAAREALAIITRSAEGLGEELNRLREELRPEEG